MFTPKRQNIKAMNRYLRTIFLLTVIFVFGCSPRGETLTVDQVLADAQTHFTALMGQVDTSGMKQTLADAAASLAALAASEPSKETLRSQGEIVIDKLATLTEGAGYTSRPALGEISTQFRALTMKEDAPSFDTVKLLVARSYNLLASELEGVKFQLRDREMK
jgi:hypothetical protein